MSSGRPAAVHYELFRFLRDRHRRPETFGDAAHFYAWWRARGDLSPLRRPQFDMTSRATPRPRPWVTTKRRGSKWRGLVSCLQIFGGAVIVLIVLALLIAECAVISDLVSDQRSPEPSRLEEVP